jgi:hypothetical protein
VWYAVSEPREPVQSMERARQSAELHARVQEFARRWAPAQRGGHDAAIGALEQSKNWNNNLRAPWRAEFESLALDIARFQARFRPLHARTEPLTLAEVPIVPADAFRYGRLAAHAPSEDVVVFQTSGTTGGSGRHALCRTDTYALLCELGGRAALIEPAPRVTLAALMVPFEPARSSSLGFMVQHFMDTFDGRPGARRFLIDAEQPLSAAAVDGAGLVKAAKLARARAEPLVLCTTAFALAFWLERAPAGGVPLPPGSRVMPTGGFKGHRVEVSASELEQRTLDVFGLAPHQIVSEYGMTELASQLYAGGLDALGTPWPRDVFRTPPWLWVEALDPVSLTPVPAGEEGLACFWDLGNVDSVLRVLTQDRIRCTPHGIALLGRAADVRVRGCSVPLERLWGPNGH